MFMALCIWDGPFWSLENLGVVRIVLALVFGQHFVRSQVLDGQISRFANLGARRMVAKHERQHDSDHTQTSKLQKRTIQMHSAMQIVQTQLQSQSLLET